MSRFQHLARLCLAMIPLGAQLTSPVQAAPPASQRSVSDASGLRQLYRDEHFSLARVRHTNVVPPIFPRRLPPDLGAPEVTDYEHLFIRIVLPAIVRSNAHIEADRDRLLRISREAPTQERSPEDARWLEELAGRYAGSAEDLAELARRVDIIPASLTIAQAIDASGWGRSHFAIEGNSLFGQHAPRQGGPTSMGAARDGASLAAFETIGAAVDSHAHDLNTNHAYAELRSRRAGRRAKGGLPRGRDLVSALESYSERGAAYVDSLKSIMRHHHLADFDAVELEAERRPIVIAVQPATQNAAP